MPPNPVHPTPPPRTPVGNGKITGVIPDPAAALAAVGIRATTDDTGRISFDPDPATLPTQLVPTDGYYDLGNYVSLLAAAVQALTARVAALEGQAAARPADT